MISKRIVEKASQVTVDDKLMLDVAKRLTGLEDPAEALTEFRVMCHKSFVAGIGDLANQLVVLNGALIERAPMACQEKLIEEAAKLVATVRKVLPEKAKG